jgi:hypothetical protein
MINEEFIEEERYDLNPILDIRAKNKVVKFNEFTKTTEIINKIEKYGFGNFIIDYNKINYTVNIVPDFTFKKLCKDLNELSTDNDVRLENIEFNLSVERDNMNRIHITEGIPILLRGLRLGYHLYKMVADCYGFISTDKTSSYDAKNLWWHLICDKDYYAITGNNYTIIIAKKLHQGYIETIIIDILNYVYKLNLFTLDDIKNIESDVILKFDSHLLVKFPQLKLI